MDIGQILQLGVSGVLAAGIVALWREFQQLRKEQREDSQKWQETLLTLLREGRADRKAIAQSVGADVPSRTDLPIIPRESTYNTHKS